MINILHIHTLPVISGSGINTFLSMRGMDRQIFRVDLACAPGGRLIDLVEKNLMRVFTFKNMVQPLHPLKDLLATMQLIRFLKKSNYHIVHTHNSKAGFIGRLAARIAHVPVIIHTVHGFAFHEQEPPWRRYLFRSLERMASHCSDKMIFISQPLIDWALKERIADKKKIVKIYSGIDLEKFHPPTEKEKNNLRDKWNIGRNDAVIGFVSKLWDGKGHSTLIKAFKKVKNDISDARLVIVGEGYLENRLRNLSDRLGMASSVIFTGFQYNVSEIIACFDIAVLPSFFEGMGRVLLEAMAMGKPVVASRVGGIPDLVEDGVNGLLITPGNIEELANSLKKLLRDKSLAANMGKEGINSVTDNFSSEVMVKSIRYVYIDQLERKGIKLDV
jgi:glycosyltransferase involved in cell wall biosynthesis